MEIIWEKPTLLQFGPTEECGCPFERWQYYGVVCDMHFEADGSVDVFMDAGDWTRDLGAASREDVFKWIEALPVG